MCPLIVSSVLEQYLFVWVCVRPSHDAQLPDLIATSNVNLTGKPAAESRYLISADRLRIFFGPVTVTR